MGEEDSGGGRKAPSFQTREEKAAVISQEKAPFCLIDADSDFGGVLSLISTAALLPFVPLPFLSSSFFLGYSAARY